MSVHIVNDEASLHLLPPTRAKTTHCGPNYYNHLGVVQIGSEVKDSCTIEREPEDYMARKSFDDKYDRSLVEDVLKLN